MPEVKDQIRDPLAPPADAPLSVDCIAEATTRPDVQPIAVDAVAGPTPQQIDTMIRNFESAVRWKKAATDLEADCKQALITVVRVYGHPAAGSEHSSRIEGALNTATVTDVTTTTLNEEKIHAFAELLSLNNRGDLFPRMFSHRVKHQLVDGADDVLRTAQMPNNLRVRAKAAFAECIKVGSSAPRVKVDMLQPEPKAPRRKKAKAEA